jgi:hypothetical protein
MSANKLDEVNLSQEFQEKFRLANMIIAVTAFATFSILFIFYLRHIKLKTVEMQTKIITFMLATFTII